MVQRNGVGVVAEKDLPNYVLSWGEGICGDSKLPLHSKCQERQVTLSHTHGGLTLRIYLN